MLDSASFKINTKANTKRNIQGGFYLFLPIFSTKMKNKLQPTRTTFSRNFQCRKAPRWLSKFFHFGTENGEEQLKKAPCILPCQSSSRGTRSGSAISSMSFVTSDRFRHKVEWFGIIMSSSILLNLSIGETTL